MVKRIASAASALVLLASVVLLAILWRSAQSEIANLKSTISAKDKLLGEMAAELTAMKTASKKLIDSYNNLKTAREDQLASAKAENQRLTEYINYLLDPKPSFRKIEPLYPATPSN